MLENFIGSIGRQFLCSTRPFHFGDPGLNVCEQLTEFSRVESFLPEMLAGQRPSQQSRRETGRYRHVKPDYLLAMASHQLYGPDPPRAELHRDLRRACGRQDVSDDLE